MVFFKNKTVKASFFLAILLSLWTGACNFDKGKNIPDVSHIEVEVKIKRFDKDLMSMDTNHIKRDMDVLIEKYPVFMPDIYLPKILPILQDTTVMKQFLISPGIQKLYDTCMIVYDNPVDIEKELESAFRFYKYYFSHEKLLYPNRSYFKFIILIYSCYIIHFSLITCCELSSYAAAIQE